MTDTTPPPPTPAGTAEFSHAPRKRPGAVTFISALIMLQGLVGIAVGIFVAVDNDDPDLIDASGLTEDELLAAGIAAIVLGALALVGGLLLLSGSEFIRAVVGFIAVLNVASGVYGLVAFDGEQRLSATFSAFVAGFVLFLLFGDRRTNDWFAAT